MRSSFALTPTRVTLAVQSDRRTVIQPDAIARMADELGVQLDVIEDSSKEYRHGKLIEVVDYEGTRWALTGSANLSARALLHSAEDGGNIELGIISRLHDSLFPEGSPIALCDVPAVRIKGSANRPATAVLIIAAVQSSDGLSVQFAEVAFGPGTDPQLSWHEFRLLDRDRTSSSRDDGTRSCWRKSSRWHKDSRCMGI